MPPAEVRQRRIRRTLLGESALTQRAQPQEAPRPLDLAYPDPDAQQRWLAEAARAEAEACAGDAPDVPPAAQPPPTRDGVRCSRKAAAYALCCPVVGPAYVACAALGAPGCAECRPRLALLRALTCGLPACLFAAYAAALAGVCCLQCDCCDWQKERRTAVAATLACRAWGDTLSGDDPRCVRWALAGEQGPCLAEW